MRRALAAVLVLAACSGEKTHSPAATGPEKHAPKPPPCCIKEPAEPWVWQEPQGPRSLGVVAALVVNGSRVVAGTYRGILFSSDAGATWRASSELAAGGEDSLVQARLALLARNAFGGAISTTVNDGQSWTQPFPDLGFNSLTSDARGGAWASGIDHDFKTHVFHTKEGVNWKEVDLGSAFMVVGGEDFDLAADFGGNLSLSDDGDSWSPIGTPPGFSSIPYLASWKGSIFTIVDGPETKSIASSPDRGASWSSFDAGIWVGQRAWFAPSPDGLFLVTAIGEILRLRDPAGTWESIERPANPGRITVDAAYGCPEGTFLARGGSLSRWNDATSAFEPFGQRPVGAIVNGMATDGEVVWALVDGREVHRSPDGGRSWQAVTTPPAQSLISLAAHHGSAWVGTLQEGLYRSDDGGSTWIDLSGAMPHYNGTAGDQPRDVIDLLADDTGLYVSTGGLEFLGASDGNFQGTSAGVLFSSDGGETFDAFTSGLPFLDPNTLPLGSQTALASLGRLVRVGPALFVDAQGGPYRSIDAGHTWNGPIHIGGDQPTGELRNMVLSGVSVLAAFVTDPTHPAGLFRSTDGGNEFLPLDTRPPGNTLMADLVRTPRGLAALMVTATPLPVAEEGVWESLDEGATWTRAGSGAPARDGQRLAVTDHELLVSTSGAGVARLPTDAAP